MRPRDAARAAALALALSACACRAFEPAAPALELELPATWTARAVDAREPASLWWGEFDDPALSALVDEALAHNRDLGAAVARLEAALAQARIAGSRLWPALDAGLSGARRRQNFIGLPIPGGGVLASTTTSYGASLDLSWELDLWGRLRAVTAAADADARASAADATGVALSLAAQTSKSWFALIESRAQVELARDTLASWEANASWIRARYERGLASALDLRLALASSSEARAAAAARQDAAQRIARQLEVLLGRYPDAELLTAEGAPRALPDLPPEPPVGLPASLIERRPDLLAARQRVAAADQRVAQSKAALLPGLRLTASGGRASTELGDLLDGDFTVWSLGAGLTAPLFSAGRLRAESDVAQARALEAWNAWEQRVLQACAEVEQALAAEQHLAERESALAAATRAARAAEQLAVLRYRSGVEPLVTLLDVQRRAASSESRWIETRRVRLDNYIDLLLALGGGFGSPADAGPPLEAESGP